MVLPYAILEFFALSIPYLLQEKNNSEHFGFDKRRLYAS